MAETDPIRVFSSDGRWLVDYGSYVCSFHDSWSDALGTAERAAKVEGRELQLEWASAQVRMRVDQLGRGGPNGIGQGSDEDLAGTDRARRSAGRPLDQPDSELVALDPDRLRAVQESGLVNQSSETFDNLTRLAYSLLRVPATFLSIVEERRDFYLSNVGFGEPLRSTRALWGKTFCHLAIANDGPLVINDTRLDPVHRAIPTVETLGVAAYLGVPVRLPDDQVLGAFCAIDNEPREWTELERDIMVELARSAELQIALQDAARREAQRALLAEAVAGELVEVRDELERSQWRIRRLHELLPLCMKCHQVRGPDDGWEPLVDLLDRDGLFVNRGYCPKCAAPDLGEVA